MSTTDYDNSWKGTTGRFILHYHEQFRQLDEVTPLGEHLPHSVRLTLLQTAVRSIPELKIVETMEEYMPLTQSSSGQYSLTHDKYFMMLQNACIQYDMSLRHKPSPTSRAIYQHDIDDDDPLIYDEWEDYQGDDLVSDGIDTPSDCMYNVHQTNFERPPHVKSLTPRKPNEKFKSNKNPDVKPRYNGPVYLPKHIYHIFSEETKKELDKHNRDKKAQYKPPQP